jgi:hypothetical protein
LEIWIQIRSLERNRNHIAIWTAEGDRNGCILNKKIFPPTQIPETKIMEHRVKKEDKVLFFRFALCSMPYTFLLFDERKHHPKGGLTFPRLHLHLSFHLFD